MDFHFLVAIFAANHKLSVTQNEVKGRATIQIEVSNHSRELMHNGWSEDNYACVTTFTAEQRDALILTN